MKLAVTFPPNILHTFRNSYCPKMAQPLDAVPLRVPYSYSPEYKVELRLHESLWEVAMSGPDLVIEVMTFCSQLELLCQREYHETTQKPGFRGRKRNYSNTFGTQANLILDKVEKVLQCLPKPSPTVPEYLNMTGLALMFPRAAKVAEDPHVIPPDIKSTSVDAHFAHLASLNQITSLCQQIQSDCEKLHNHKYIAHQVALLYTTLTKFTNVRSLVEYRTSIETTFKTLKKSLSTDHPQLPDGLRNWLVNLTSSLYALVTSPEVEMKQPLKPVINFLIQTS
ncbi:uncharacterized protein [Apostichopus japonicus]|uniref:uncharacterized protein n=1 Tax=Stichopus japonicus TaxID=307972 RepID=UPI003AB78AAE